MKYIIAGGRDFYSQDILNKVLSTFSDIDEIISGQANGADKCGEVFALNNKIALTYYPANWKLYGKSAGYIRNIKMSEYGDALIAFWNGKSPGTKHMIQTMKRCGKPYFVYNYDGNRINY